MKKVKTLFFVDVSSTNLDGKDASNVMRQSRGNIR